MQNVAIIAARGGSKGVHKKNLIQIAGRPLIAWSILKARSADCIDSVWVTSDDEDILSIASDLGAEIILRPDDLASDTASSEVAWSHALNVIKEKVGSVQLVFALQATSPVRDHWDFDAAYEEFIKHGYDSLLSVNEVQDHFIWRIDENKTAISVNYDYKNRKRRQEITAHYLENGSFYMFKPEEFLEKKNRLFGKIGFYKMQKHKMFQIDSNEDADFCQALLSYYE